MATIERPGGASLPPGSRVAVVAGSGSLPADVADSLALQGLNPFVVLLADEVDCADRLARHDHATFKLEEGALAFERMRKEKVTHAILAGGVARRPRLSRLRWTPRLIKILPRLGMDLALGDDGLLRGVMRHMEANGIKIVGAHEVVPDLLTPENAITFAEPSAADWIDIKAAQVAAQAIGELDIGQAAIAIGGRVIALEGIEGTEGLLERVAALRGHGRLAGKTGGVLVKMAKPGQELRADLPAIGTDTIEQAKRAGLRGVGLQAHRTFILDFNDTVQEANKKGIFLIGVAEREP